MSQMFFNEIEAVKIGQNMEKNGLAFYEHAAARTASPTVRALFVRLADDEKKHLATFEQLEDTLQANRRDEAGYEDDPALGAYIDRLLETQVFAAEGAVSRLAHEAKDDAAAMAVGMKAERDSILFYQEMLDFVDSKAAVEAFQWILKEERRHLQILGDEAAIRSGKTE
jgi:rubrerythrin